MTSRYYTVYDHDKEEYEVLSNYDYFHDKRKNLELIDESDNYYYLEDRAEIADLYYN